MFMGTLKMSQEWSCEERAFFSQYQESYGMGSSLSLRFFVLSGVHDNNKATMDNAVPAMYSMYVHPTSHLPKLYMSDRQIMTTLLAENPTGKRKTVATNARTARWRERYNDKHSHHVTRLWNKIKGAYHIQYFKLDDNQTSQSRTDDTVVQSFQSV